MTTMLWRGSAALAAWAAKAWVAVARRVAAGHVPAPRDVPQRALPVFVPAHRRPLPMERFAG